MFNRIIDISQEHSFFLFGARGTGKSTWLNKFFSETDHLYIDLLDPDMEALFNKNPNELVARIEGVKSSHQWVVIDEIQKVPKLLDLVHLCIEKYRVNFALTGSSARKLKRGGANLLAGRAFLYHLYPLTRYELGDAFDLNHALTWGSLPQLFRYKSDKDKMRYLRTYGQTYLREEIMIEQVIRKLDPFRQFLEISAQSNGDIINYSNIARDVGVDVVTVQSYFQILEDTLVGTLLPPYHRSVRKRQRANPKFYYFDLGVKRSLENSLSILLKENTYAYGKAFEHFIIVEILRLNQYLEMDYTFSYLQTRDQVEVDLILEKKGAQTLLIEIKSKTSVDERDAKHLLGFQDDFPESKSFIFSNDPARKKIGPVLAVHWEDGFKEIFGNPFRK